MVKNLKRIYKSGDVRVLISNFISLTTLQIVGIILPLITLPYVIRVVGFEKYGVIMLALALTAYFQSLTDYSFRITATRDVAIFRMSPKKLNIVYSKVMFIKGFFLITSFLIISVIILVYPPFYADKEVFFLTALLLLGYALFPEWFFQGIEKMKYITILNVGIKLFFTISVFVFIKEKSDYWLYPLFQSAGYIGAGLLGQYIVIKKFHLRFKRLKFHSLRNTIKESFPIFVTQFFPTLYNNTTTILLGIFTLPSIVGIYSAIKKIVDLAVTVLSVISRVFFPFLNRRKQAFNKYKILMLLVSLAFIIAIIVTHRFLFWYLNIDYDQSLKILVILSLGIFGYTIYDIWGMNYFIIKRQDKLVMRNTVVASLLGFIFAFPLIYYWGIIGASINLSLARWMMGGGLLFFYLKNK